MKFSPRYLILVFCTVVGFEMNAQVEDQNTLLINTYFNLNSNNYFDGSANPESNYLQAVNILQYGNNNNIDINSSGKSQQKVNQIGNNNNFQYIDFYNSTDMKLDVLQEGNNSSIQIFGVNSMMKDMIIKQSANSKALIISNY